MVKLSTSRDIYHPKPRSSQQKWHGNVGPYPFTHHLQRTSCPRHSSFKSHWLWDPAVLIPLPEGFHCGRLHQSPGTCPRSYRLRTEGVSMKLICYMSYMFYIFHRFYKEKDRKSTCTRTNRPNYSQLFPQLSWTPCPQSASAGAPHWAGIESGILDRNFQRAGENWFKLCYIHYVKVYICFHI